MAEEKGLTIRQQLDVAKNDFVKSLESQIGLNVAQCTFEKEAGFAAQALVENSYLLNVARVNPGSLKTAIVNVALCNTTLNPVLQKAFLVPRKVGGKDRVCLDFGYRGLAGIAMDSGAVKHIQPYLVYDWDEFSFTIENGEPHLHHKMDYENVITPETFWQHIKCGYCISILKDGTKLITPPFPKWKLEKAMKTSKTSGEHTPWRTFPDEQCLKTIVKHTYKLLPQTPTMSQAVTVLNEHEGIDTAPTPFCDSLKQPKSIDQEPICICADMDAEGIPEWTCPVHGNRKGTPKN